MLQRILGRLTPGVVRTQYGVIQLVSVRQTYLEHRDANRFRKLVSVSQAIKLSRTQVAAATSHAKETLVVAGAGSGKTSVLVGRAKYLVQSKRAREDQILMLAFNKDAAEELASRTKDAGIAVAAQTFHGFGNSVIKAPGERSGVAFGEANETHRFLANQLKKGLDEHSRNTLVTYFALELVPVRGYAQFQNLSEYAAYVRAGIPVTLQDEQVKSHGEWLIANYLFTQGISYGYEALYSTENRKDRHRPDFTVYLPGEKQIYIEYFGIDRESNTAPGIVREGYLKGMSWKKSVHSINETILISLHYYDLIEGNLLTDLERELRAHEVKSSPLSNEQILAAANSVGYQQQFLKICEQFLGHVRAQRLSPQELLLKASGNPRSVAFLDIFLQLQSNYEAELARLELPDYSELIHGAADRIELGEHPVMFSHLLVDEYQDISHDRNRLITSLCSANPKLQVTYVGDDWQSILAFAGSDISIMRAASRPRRRRKRIDLGDTYRLPQEIADLSRKFILKNPQQLRKNVFSKATEQVDGKVITHWDTEVGATEENLAIVITRLGPVAKDPELSLRVIARYRDNLPSLKFIQSLWEGPVEMGTVHSSKGLEADFVIVMDMIQDFRGFPSTIEDDPVISLVLPQSQE